MSASEWRAASLPNIVNVGTGAEQIARAALVQIMQNLESRCDQLEVVWASRDQDWANLIGVPYKPTRITRVAKSSYYLGAQPSLVAGENARFDRWPAITVRCGPRKATEDRGQFDQYDSYDVELIVEALATAGPFERDPLDDRATSDAVDRQYQRLSDAIVACIDLDRTLGGNIFPLQRPASISPSLPFVKRQEAGAGKWLVYQGAELLWIATSAAF